MVRTQSRLPSLDLDAKRIAANSFVIALHAAALMLLMAPVTITPPAASQEETTTVILEEPPKIKPLQPVPVPQPTPRTPVRPQQAVTPPLAPVIPINTAEILDPAGTELAVIGDPPPINIDVGSGEPALLQLALLHGPAPQYPSQAVRARLQGEVLLRVLVDTTGRPQDVVIERSSGHRVLDQAALRTVKASWRFQPATVDGRVVMAYALVPVNFSLSQ